MATPLVVAVLTKEPLVPRRTCGIRSSGTGSRGAVARRSVATKAPATPTDAPTRSAPGSRPPSSPRSVVPTTSSMTASVIRTEPTPLSGVRRAGPGSRGTSPAIATAWAAANASSAQKMTRQVVTADTTPPTTNPDAPAAAPAALQAATARARVRSSPASVVRSLRADGTAAAAAAPCTQRPAVSTTTDVATAASREPPAKTARLARMVRRWPTRSPRRAPNISRPPKNIA